MINYISNNSGGSWWLTDEDWINLEKWWWRVFWGWFNTDHTDRKFNSYQEAEKYRWLWALATSAKFDWTEEEAIASFEDITWIDTNEEWCECCGEPHLFYNE